VKVAHPLPKPYADDPHATRQIRYRVRLEGGDPAVVFVSGPSQQVHSIDPHTAEVTVYAIRPRESGGNPDARPDPPTDDDLRPNNLIQCDDARVVAMAQKGAAEDGAGASRDPWQTALRLESYVHRLIVKKDFSQAFATAAEVAEHPEGDCTEHAVLLAALCRAQKIPARVAIGLVYLAGRDVFAYHMWTAVYVDGRWTAIDATLAKGGIGAAHLELAHSNLQGASAYSAFLPVIQVAGRLSIDVEEAR
jgi:transglutaminase-like putative cysteine protease